jgi:hypothetical protein
MTRRVSFCTLRPCASMRVRKRPYSSPDLRKEVSPLAIARLALLLVADIPTNFVTFISHLPMVDCLFCILVGNGRFAWRPTNGLGWLPVIIALGCPAMWPAKYRYLIQKVSVIEFECSGPPFSVVCSPIRLTNLMTKPKKAKDAPLCIGNRRTHGHTLSTNTRLQTIKTFS